MKYRLVGGVTERDKNLARQRTYRAVQSGLLEPPEKCEECGLKPKPSKDNRRTLQTHHHNGYEEEHVLDVIWLCPSCHKMAHPETNVWTDERKAKVSNTIKGSTLKLSESERQARAQRCKDQKPWETRWKDNLTCPSGHSDNFGTNNRGHRFCRTCANEKRRGRR